MALDYAAFARRAPQAFADRGGRVQIFVGSAAWAFFALLSDRDLVRAYQALIMFQQLFRDYRSDYASSSGVASDLKSYVRNMNVQATSDFDVPTQEALMLSLEMLAEPGSAQVQAIYRMPEDPDLLVTWFNQTYSGLAQLKSQALIGIVYRAAKPLDPTQIPVELAGDVFAAIEAIDEAAINTSAPTPATTPVVSADFMNRLKPTGTKPKPMPTPAPSDTVFEPVPGSSRTQNLAAEEFLITAPPPSQQSWPAWGWLAAGVGVFGLVGWIGYGAWKKRGRR